MEDRGISIQDIVTAHRVPQRNSAGNLKPIVCGLVRWLVKESLMSHRKDISNKNPVAVGPPEGSSLSSVRIYDHLSPRTQAVLFLAKRVCPFHVTRISCQIWNSIPYSIKLLKRSPFCKRIKKLLLNFLRSEDDYVEVPRLIMLVSLCNCYYSLCFMLVFFYLFYCSVFTVVCCLVHL